MYARTRSCCGPLSPYVAQHYKIELSGSLFSASLWREIYSRARDAGMLLRSNPIKNQKKKRSFLSPKKKSKMEIDIMNAHVIGANLFLSCGVCSRTIEFHTKRNMGASPLVCVRVIFLLFRFVVKSNNLYILQYSPLFSLMTFLSPHSLMAFLFFFFPTQQRRFSLPPLHE